MISIHKTFFLTLILQFFFVPCSLSCQVCTETSLTSCRICINECQSENFFQNCSKKQCLNGTDDFDQNNCQQFVIVDFEESECLHECCVNFSENSTFTANNLQLCQKENEESSDGLIAVIAIGMTCFICCLLIGIYRALRECSDHGFFRQCEQSYCCCLCYFIGKCCNFLMAKREVGNENENIGEQNGTSVRLKFSKNQWIQNNEYKRQQLQKNICTICLCECVDCVTNCGHFYHLNCIIQWIQRTKKCPLCVQQNINPVKFFCRFCFERLYPLTLYSSEDLQGYLIQMNGKNCPRCK